MATKSASLHAQLRVDVRFRHARHDHFPFGIPPLYSPARCMEANPTMLAT